MADTTTYRVWSDKESRYIYEERETPPITMQDTRLIAGEGELREAVARLVEGAVADAMNEPWESAVSRATDAILALTQASLPVDGVVVPREPTEAMLGAARKAYPWNRFPIQGLYRAMIDAALSTSPNGKAP
jgi:hypothetical protein